MLGQAGGRVGGNFVVFALIADAGDGGDDGGGADAEGFVQGAGGMSSEDFVDGDGALFEFCAGFSQDC